MNFQDKVFIYKIFLFPAVKYLVASYHSLALSSLSSLSSFQISQEFHNTLFLSKVMTGFMWQSHTHSRVVRGGRGGGGSAALA